MHEGTSLKRKSHVIELPKKVHRPKVTKAHSAEPVYPNVDEGYFLSEEFGKAVFRPRNWDMKPRDDIIMYNARVYHSALNEL